LWTDAYLLAFASECGAAIVTFDEALAARAGVTALR
jgi:predicted nucleic acid-binding protein